MERSEGSEEKIIEGYLGRLVTLQQKVEQPRDEMNDLRREARAEGVNVEALNVLVPLISKYPHDKGAGVLKEVIRYAEIFGAEILAGTANAGSHHSPKRVLDVDVPQAGKAEVRAPAVSAGSSTADTPLRLSTQVVAAVFLTIGLIWLLN